jgi:uncharacterized protein (DUF885 family)
VFAFSSELVEVAARLRPMQATFWGVRGFAHAWDDVSPEGFAHAADVLRALRPRAVALSAATDDRWSRLAAHVAVDFLDKELAWIDRRGYLRDLNAIDSTFQVVRMVFDTMDTSTPQGWLDVAARLDTIDVVLGNYRRALEAGLAAGEVVAARQVRKVIEQGRVHAGDRSYFATLASDYARTSNADPTIGRRIEAGAAGARRAYGALTDWLEQTYLPNAREIDGVGRARYEPEARRWLGCDVDLDEAHAWGWTELARILARMRELARAMYGDDDVTRALARARADAALSAPSLEAFLELMRARQARALELVDPHFDVPEALRKLDVRAAPPSAASGAYYVPPSEDLSRPGAIYYLMPDDGPVATFDQVSTAYHEGTPGHHLQCGTQVALTQHLSRLHRVAYGYSGFAEGWALYAEELMRELGGYEEPGFELGQLANDAIRACRVVFDIGAHLGLVIPSDAPFHPGEAWTFDLGVELLESFGGLTRARASDEITRYLGWPAQAISYKLGQRAMLALRAEFLAQGGALRDFHTRVLACGNVSLDLLRGQVLG